jgi:hypothetical protein
MLKENDYPNIQSPFSPDLDPVMRDEQKSEGSLTQVGDKGGKDSKPSVTMDGGIPTDTLEESDSNFPE